MFRYGNCWPGVLLTYHRRFVEGGVMELSERRGKPPADAPFVATAKAALDIAKSIRDDVEKICGEDKIEQLRERCQALELENAALRRELIEERVIVAQLTELLEIERSHDDCSGPVVRRRAGRRDSHPCADAHGPHARLGGGVRAVAGEPALGEHPTGIPGRLAGVPGLRGQGPLAGKQNRRGEMAGRAAPAGAEQIDPAGAGGGDLVVLPLRPG